MDIGRLISEGRTAEVYEQKDDRVIKFFKKDMPVKAIEYEYNISKMLAEKGFNVANTYNIIPFNNRLGIVYDRIYGNTMMKELSRNPLHIFKNAKCFAELHLDIHKKIDNNELVSYKGKLIEDINSTNILEEAVKEKIIAYTRNLTDGDCLCHGDFHPDNILLSGKKYYIIDWMTATKGDSLCDVARTIIMLKYGTLPNSIKKIDKVIITIFKKIFLNQYIKYYVRMSGEKKKSLKKWMIPVAAARLVECLPMKEKEQLIDYINRELKVL